MTNGLFTSVTGAATLENIILYSPDGNARVTGGSTPTGGLVGSVTGYSNITISNSVVAGYTMEASQPLGGLVGEVNEAYATYLLTIHNCEAVNALHGTNAVGGLVGRVTKGEVRLTNSYAGGEVTGGAYGGGQGGGIVGSGTNNNSAPITYTNVYSYTTITTSVKYGIGPCGYYSASSNCSYWSGGITGTVSDEANTSKAVDYAGLKTCIAGGAADAEHTYSSAATSGAYPFPAVVTDSAGAYVHYGDWPNDPSGGSGDPGLPGPELFGVHALQIPKKYPDLSEGGEA